MRHRHEQERDECREALKTARKRIATLKENTEQVERELDAYKLRVEGLEIVKRELGQKVADLESCTTTGYWVCSDSIDQAVAERDEALRKVKDADRAAWTAWTAWSQEQNKELRQKVERYELALTEIAGGIGTTMPLPSMGIEPAEFRSDMWTWSRKRARAARKVSK